MRKDRRTEGVSGDTAGVGHGYFTRDDSLRALPWARRARQLHADFGLPTNPQISLTLCYALAYGGQLDASVLEIETAIAEAVDIGSAADFDRAEALFIKAYLRSAQGLPNGTEVAEEALSIGRRTGNIQSICRALSALGMSLADSDPEPAQPSRVHELFRGG